MDTRTPHEIEHQAALPADPRLTPPDTAKPIRSLSSTETPADPVEEVHEPGRPNDTSAVPAVESTLLADVIDRTYLEEDTHPAPARTEEQPSAVVRRRLSRESFEWLLGAKGLALAGMLIVVVGVGMFLKYAYDEGWMGAISPMARCGAAAGFGIAMLAVGEILRRRINALASAGASATGVAVIYASILAASNLYDLLSTTATFVMLAGITALGVLLGSLSNRVMLALLSLVGAFLVPFMLESSEPSRIAMPSYLLSLLVLGLVLAGWRGGGYANVRRLAWWSTGIVGTLWITTVYDTAPAYALAFVSAVWLATVAELVVSARFFKALRDRTEWPENSVAGFVRGDNEEIMFNLRALFSPEARWLNSIFGVTAWSVVTTAIVVRQIDVGLDWLAPLSFGLASVTMAAVTLRLRRSAVIGLWARNPSPRSALAAALVFNAALLVVATVAMALGGWAQVAAWCAIGLAAIESGRRLRFRASDVFGFALLGVAAARLFTIDAAEHLLGEAVAQPLGLYITAWSGQVVYVALAAAAGAWRTRHDLLQRAAATVSLWLLAATLAHPEASPDALGPTWLCLAAAAVWLTTQVQIRPLRVSAYILAGLGMAVSLFGQIAIENTSPAKAMLSLNPSPMIVALLAWTALAAIPRLSFNGRWTCALLAITSGAIAIASLHETRGVLETLLLGAGYAGVVIALSQRLYRWSLAEIAGGLLLVLSAGWVTNRVSAGSNAIEGVAIGNLAFVLAFTTVVLWIFLAWRLSVQPAAKDAPDGLAAVRAQFQMVALGIAWLLLLAATSLDVLRGVGQLLEQRSAQGAALSIWWSLFAVATVALGFRLSAILRWAGLALLGVVAFKVLLLDTQTLTPPARIIAAISVGLVTIGAGVLYARLKKWTNDPDAGGSQQRE
ncbi:MAG: DUF2339 domain-containing protein [Planctomycetota bacterium]